MYRILFFLLGIFLLKSAFAETPQLSFAVGQMMMVGFNGTEISDNTPIVNEIKNYHIGGVILDNHRQPGSTKIFSNIKNPKQLKKLISDLQFYAKKYHAYPLLIAVNQEGGLINTLKESNGFVSQNNLSQYQLGKEDSQKIYSAAYQRALLLKDLGINLNLAPVADLNVNPENPAVGKLERSFGDNPEKVTEQLQETIKAYKNAQVLCALKHFPGLGSANKNTDYDDADLTSTWKPLELIPYKKLIKSNMACDFVMVTHLVNRKLDDSGIPVSLSKKVVSKILLDQLHFKGLVITDDMDAAAIRKNIPTQMAIEKAVLAGNNVIIYGGTQGYDPEADAKMLFDTLMRLAKKSSKIRSKVYYSYDKIMRVKSKLNGE